MPIVNSRALSRSQACRGKANCSRQHREPVPGIEAPLLPGKALVELALAEAGVPYSIVRPTLVFGGDRDVLVNNIAWILRRVPIFAMPGNGGYPVQPVHVDDLARICLQSAGDDGDDDRRCRRSERRYVRGARPGRPPRGRGTLADLASPSVAVSAGPPRAGPDSSTTWC